MAKVCVDATGGDFGAAPVLEGLELALHKRPNMGVLLAGPKEVVESFASAHPQVEPLITTETIGMDEHPTASVRTKKDSEIVAGCAAVGASCADAFFSAGSTGAILAAATLYVKRIKGVFRPALTIFAPSPDKTPTVLLDIGANADCKPEYLVQFAKMGSLLARIKGFSKRPQVSLLSNGSEKSKGSTLTQSYFQALQEAHEANEIIFAGNCEGSDLLTGEKDVIVCDGFSGNIAIKSVEASAKFIASMLKHSAATKLPSALGALLLKKPMHAIVDAISGNEHGGALLLGLKAPVYIGHGKSTPYAIQQGILAAEQSAEENISQSIAHIFA